MATKSKIINIAENIKNLNCESVIIINFKNTSDLNGAEAKPKIET